MDFRIILNHKTKVWIRAWRYEGRKLPTISISIGSDIMGGVNSQQPFHMYIGPGMVQR
jgi:hypothetical protein